MTGDLKFVFLVIGIPIAILLLAIGIHGGYSLCVTTTYHYYFHVIINITWNIFMSLYDNYFKFVWGFFMRTFNTRTITYRNIVTGVPGYITQYPGVSEHRHDLENTDHVEGTSTTSVTSGLSRVHSANQRIADVSHVLCERKHKSGTCLEANCAVCIWYCITIHTIHIPVEVLMSKAHVVIIKSWLIIWSTYKLKI